MAANTLIPTIALLYIIAHLALCQAKVVSGDGQQEDPSHGARSPHERFEEDHWKGGQHHEDLDHQAVLGSRKDAEAYDTLPPDEAKRRLRLLCKTQIDTDHDGVVTKDETVKFITKNMISLDSEEAEERFEEMDEDNDGFVTWEEYVEESFGSPQDMDPEDKKLLEEDKLYFHKADLNSDGKLDKSEFLPFQVPENHPHMHDAMIDFQLKDKDENGDGVVSFDEFMKNVIGDQYAAQDQEWIAAEKERFETDYDSNRDGVLDRAEVRRWLVPDVAETAKEEAEHLFRETKSAEATTVTCDEIVDKHDVWVGSEATNFGDTLHRLGDEL